MRQPLLMLLCALFFLAGGVLLAFTGAGLVLTAMLFGMGVVGLLAVPIAWGQARNDARAGGLATRAKGGYAVLGVLGMAVFALIGLAMVVFGVPLDEGKDTLRVPNSALEARILARSSSCRRPGCSPWRPAVCGAVARAGGGIDS